MESGIKVYTSTGFLQIDSTFKNLTLLRKEVVHCPPLPTDGYSKHFAPNQNPYQFYKGNGPSNQQWFGRFERIGEGEAGILPHTEDIRLLCVGLTDTPVAVVRHRGHYKIINVSTSPKDITCYLFTDKASTTGNSGFQIYDSTGQLVFDANRKYMRVADYRALTHSVDVCRIAELPLPREREYALCYTNFWYVHDYFADGDDPWTSTITWYFIMPCAFMFDGAVLVDPLKLYLYTNTGGWAENPSHYQSYVYSHMIVDVTGY